VKQTGNYYYAFLVCAVFAVLGTISYVFVIDRHETIHWS
jgi:hypothetical protein